jgi:hypothetical protein
MDHLANDFFMADQAEALFLSADRLIEGIEDPMQGRMVVQV